MTTMSYALNLNDSEAITIEAALSNLLRLSQEEIASGGGAPYYAYISNIEKILKQLHSNVTQTSGNYIDDSGEYVMWVNTSPEE